MPRSTTDSPPEVQIGDVVIASILLVVFASAYMTAQDWPFKARLFPELICIAGMAFAGFKLLAVGVQARRRHSQLGQVRPGDLEADTQRAADRDADEDADEAASIEYVFGSATRREWATALAWIGVFFVALYVIGVFITVPLFALAYLLIAARVGWLGAVIYAAVAGGVIWYVFYYLLYVPMPAGIF